MSRLLILLNDTLRIADNPLLNAPNADDQAYALVLLDAQQFSLASSLRKQLLATVIRNFAEQLAQLGIPLHCIIAPAKQALPQFIQQWRIDKLYAATPTAINETQLFAECAKLCNVELIDCNSLFADELAPNYQKFPRSCSQFRSQREPNIAVAPTVQTAITADAFVGETQIPFDAALLEHAALFTKYTSQGAQAHWQHYRQSSAYQHYLATRNQLIGTDYASFISTALALGTLSVRQCWQDIVAGPMHDSAKWLLQELIWREYFRHYFRVHGAQCFQFAGLGKRAPLPVSQTQLQNFKRWQQGNTGVPFIDANMRLLQQTGLMSNRGRQNVASYLVFELGVDWRLGAQFFEQQLLDYDVASNWGNWAYIAGAGEGPARHFNVMKQAVQYDPEAAFVSKLLPEVNSLLQKSAKHRPYATDIAAPWQDSWQPYLPDIC